jgi:putative endonuclease
MEGHQMYYTYVLYSSTKGIYYIGQTNNLQDRILRHNQNRNKYTKGKGPWELVFSRSFGTRREAVELEQSLKKFRNRTYLERWISSQNQSSPVD